MSRTFELGDLDKRVLLTGAGLSRNWGGYLVREMWGAILSDPNVQAHPELTELMLRQLNFEQALEEVRLRTERFTQDAQDAMEKAVKAAFLLQDRNICHELAPFESGSWKHFSETVIWPLVGKDRHHPERTSFFFTLNQDLLLERGLRRPAQDALNVPGVPGANELWFANEPTRAEFAPHRHAVSIAAELPADMKLLGRLNYVKLHGSFNWNSLGSTDSMLVLGGGKKDALSRFPLLQAYFDLFRQVLLSGGVRLLVIGYSFHDNHVNEILADAVRTAGLRLIIVDPRPPEDLRRDLLLGEFGDIWEGIVEFVNRPLAEIFATTPSGILSGEIHRFQRSFLEMATR